MAQWQVQDAKARFSELLDLVEKKGPQIVTRRGVETVVIVPIAEWRRMQAAAKPNIIDVLLAPFPKADIPLPKRGRLQQKRVPDFE